MALLQFLIKRSANEDKKQEKILYLTKLVKFVMFSVRSSEDGIGPV
jgi:hypothetical protein